jgi:hypothetical protein
MSVILNFRRIKVALNLQGVVDLAQRHDLLALSLLWAIIVGFAAMCPWVLRHKKVFA